MRVRVQALAARPTDPGPPRITRRALQADAKEERRQRILAAAEQVLRASPQREIGVAEVAEAAELAKGTVYLYFPSKDELLLAVHERQVEQFFGALSEAAASGPLAFDDILQLIDRHTLSSSIYLPLATRCLTSLGSALPDAVRSGYRNRIAGHLARVGLIIESRFQGLEAGGEWRTQHLYLASRDRRSWHASMAHRVRSQTGLIEGADLHNPEEMKWLESFVAVLAEVQGQGFALIDNGLWISATSADIHAILTSLLTPLARQ